MKKTVFLAAPWFQRNSEFSSAKYIFTSKGCLCKCDGLLSWWQPSELLYWFDGPKGFYCAEPTKVPSVWQQPAWQEVIERLGERFIYRPGSDCVRNRIPHDTHYTTLNMRVTGERQRRCVAVVSNNHHGRSGQFFSISLRNRLVCNRHVDLFGRLDSWKRFERRFFLIRRPPRNYRGPIPGDWRSDEVIDLYSKYKVVICLENSIEDNYFTEKFVNAVRGGAIPVYHAHKSVRLGVLQNARWIDPEDYGFDANATLRAALDADLQEFQRANHEWLLSDAVAATESSSVRDAICDAMFNAV